MNQTEFKTALGKFKLAETEVISLCQRLNLTGWKVKVDAQPRRRLGQCRYRAKEIGFSLHYLLHGTDECVLETARHEVAHALAFVRVHDTGHGEGWKAACTITGAKPVRCADADEIADVLAESKYVLYCPGCDKVVGAKHRAPREGRFYTCRVCKSRIEVRS